MTTLKFPSARFLLGLLGLLLGLPLGAPAAPKPDLSLFARSNLVAWCIVPFDAQRRGPEARARMLENLEVKRLAYDYRAEHIPTFDAELEALARQDIELVAWWFPGELNDEARGILTVLRRHRVRPQLWITGGGEPARDAAEQAARVAAEARRVEPIARAAADAGCAVGLYNHGGWFGEPENQVAVIQALQAQGVTNVGIVYNQHHGHAHLDRFAPLLRLMKPYLIALNLNGMDNRGDEANRKILPLGCGERDLEMLRIIAESGWRGPVGILNHTDEDAEGRLLDNLEGLDWLVEQLRGEPASRRPRLRTWRDYWGVEDPDERARLPLYQTLPAAEPHELTPANGFPPRDTYRSWRRSHGDNGGTRFSALTQINRENVGRLRVAWTYHSGDGKDNIQCNPIIVDNLMIAPTPGKYIVGVDAAGGREVWRFKPDGRPAFRGLVYWTAEGGAPARVFFCAGPFLYALDPKTGQPIPGFGDGGRVRLPGRTQGDFGAATAAPACFEKIVVVPGFEKDVWGFDAVSGKHLWTFHTVPQPGEFGHDTWDRPQDYSANCWGGMAMDASRGIAYITTGSPKPNFIGVGHRGQNLFANCLVAIDARSGRRLWHFQEIAHDIWDLDIPAPPNLGTIQVNGRGVDVVTAVTKVGNTLLLDRVSGKPIFPWRLRRAPTSDLRGEVTWPYQPDPELPEPFSKQEYTEADLTDRTEEAAADAALRFKSATTGFYRPGSEGRANLFFGIDGGAEWTGACIDPDTGRLYVTANHIGWLISIYRDEDPPEDPALPKTPGRLVYEKACQQCHGDSLRGIGVAPPLRGLRHRLTDQQVTQQIRQGLNGMPAQPDLPEADVKALLDYLMLRDRPVSPVMARGERPRYNSSGYPKFYDYEGYPANKPPWGTLNCLDLNTGKLLWKVPLGEYPELTAQGVPITGTENYGGAIVTAGGLVFCSGTRDHKIRAFDKETGKELWSAPLPYVGNAPPASYAVSGRQYIVIAATGANKLGTPYGDAYVAFALPEEE